MKFKVFSKFINGNIGIGQLAYLYQYPLGATLVLDFVANQYVVEV